MGGWSNWRKFKSWQCRSAEAPRPPTQLSAAGQGLLFTSTKVHVPPAFKFFSLSALALVIIWSLRNDDDDGNESGKKAIGSDKLNNNFARASRSLGHFSAVVARPQRETAIFHVLSRTETQDNNFLFSFPELWCSPLEFNSKNLCQHLTN